MINYIKILRKSELMVLAYKSGLELVEYKLKVYKANESIYSQDIKVLKFEIECKDIAIRELKKKLEIAQKEKDEIQFNVDKFKNASKSLNKLIESRCDNCKKDLGINAVSTLYTGNFMPLTPDLSFTVLLRLVVIDDFSRFTWVFFLATKDETSGILKSFITGIENLVDHKVKVIRCDNGTEFKNKEMNQFCEMKGILRQYSVARTPQQNGVAERRNRTLIEAARTMLADSKLPTTFWAEVVNTACYVQNRVLVVKPHNKTPYELFHGRTPTLSFMRPFRCPVTILNTIDHLGKFDGKADEEGVDEDPRKENECNDQEKEDNVNIINNVNAASTNEVNDVGRKTSIELPFDLNMSVLEDYSIFDNEDDGVEADMNNFGSTIQLHKTRRDEKNLEELDLLGRASTNSVTEVWRALEDLPHGKRAIRTLNGFLGNTKIGIDYDEVFAPVARIEAIRLFLAYASFKDFVVYQMDVKSAFLYGKIEEEVYVCQPPGFEDLDFPDRVYKVEKALYGLHQAPRAWYETLSTYLLDNEFQRGKIDKTLFIKRYKGDILLMSSMGELTFFLGLQVQQKKDGIFISQDKYVVEILKKFGFTEVKTASTPMETQKPLLKDEDGEEVDVHMYRSMIGSLMYLTSSRPDIMFAVCACARYQVNPKVSHLHDVKRIFRYLKGQPKLGLWYPKDSPFDLVAYTDSDYAGASLDRKSTTGGCQFLGCRLISWQCKKQTVVANSTTEAEYVAASKLGEGSAIPTDPHHTPTIIESSSQPQKTQKPRKPKRKDTQVPQPSDPSDNVADEAAHKELGDSLVRAATTASSLEAEQDIGGGPRCQETMGDIIAQTRFENVSKLSYDLLLARGNTLRSDEDRLKLDELMELYTNLQKKVLDLEKTKTSQDNKIASLNRRVKKLEKKNRSRTHKLKRLRKVGATARVESSGDEEDLGEDASKQGRRINAIDTDEDITLVNDDADKEMFDVDALNGEEVFIAGAQNPKLKGLLSESQLAKRLQAEEQEQFTIKEEATLFKELLEQRRKYFAAKRAEEKKNKPPTKNQQNKIMITYLKNMEGWKYKDLKSKDLDSIKELLDKAFTRKKVDDVQETTKVDDDQEAAKIKELMEIVPDEEEIAIDAIPLAVKSLRIIYMLVEKKYPLTPLTLSQMLEKKLQIDYESEMDYQLFTAALIDVNAAQSKLVLLENFNESYSKCLRLLYKVNAAEGVNAASEEVSTAKVFNTYSIRRSWICIKGGGLSYSTTIRMRFTTTQSEVKRMILAAQSEAFKEENALAEMLRGLDQQMEKKAYATRYSIHPGLDKMYYDLRVMYWWQVDRLTKSAHFLVTHEDYSMEKLSRLYIDEIVARHGVPASITSDRDGRFASQF
ncbi:putative ribonuclease H-like domain-containing protein [Tanacetum coccineum]|uniref:Ribonuclease H-like domain-containing protein n=1 Tax=Tanacetum coccineum TaxID=301880 RepID=A0ABQ5BET2_9ASTR